MSTKYANVDPKSHFLIAMGLLLGSMGIMLALAPLGMCYLDPLAAWSSACNFKGNLLVSVSDKIQLSKDNCDTIYDKEDWQKQPTITYPDAIQGRKYTVFVLDPDAPDHPNGTYYLHMLQTNVKGEDLKEGNLMKSMTLASYIGPTPSQGRDFHRYMFVIYQHCQSSEIIKAPGISNRENFDLDKWFGSIPIKMFGPKAGLQFRASVMAEPKKETTSNLQKQTTGDLQKQTTGDLQKQTTESL